MALGVKVDLPDMAATFRGLEGEHATILTVAMRGATDTLKTSLRDQVTAAGMGSRLANTWRANSYPQTGISLDPAGYAWSSAPDIIDAFSKGATIVPLGGKKYLWIPTKRVPRAPGAGRATSTKRMSPPQLLASLGIESFIIRKGRGGRLLAFVAEQRGQTKRGRVKRVRKGMLAHGDDSQLVLMYTLTKSVKLPKDLDPQDAADHAAADFVDRYEQGVR